MPPRVASPALRFLPCWLVAALVVASPTYAGPSAPEVVPAPASVAVAPASPPAPPDPATVSDGPYLRHDGTRLHAAWVCDGKPVHRSYRTRWWPVKVRSRCGYEGTLRVRAPATVDVDLPVQGVRRIAALSDIHGQFALATRLLRANGIIDRKHRWRFGAGHLVVVGDVFDRGPQVTETLWLLYSLEQQARKAGGAVHVLLGNHETMVLYDDLRYVHPKYLASAATLGMSYPALYAADSVLGRWLRTRPTLGRINDLLFVHGGIEPNHFDLGLDEAAINTRYRQSLGTPKAELKRDPVLARLYDGKTSPIWYRGYFRADGLQQADVDAIAARLGVRHIVVGHTSMAQVGSWFNGTIVAVDSSIKNGESGELLLIEDGRMSRGTLDGKRLPLLPQTAQAAQ